MLLSEFSCVAESGFVKEPHGDCVDLSVRDVVYEDGNCSDEPFSKSDERSVSGVRASCQRDGIVTKWRGIEEDVHTQVVSVGDVVVSTGGVRRNLDLLIELICLLPA